MLFIIKELRLIHLEIAIDAIRDAAGDLILVGDAFEKGALFRIGDKPSFDDDRRHRIFSQHVVIPFFHPARVGAGPPNEPGKNCLSEPFRGNRSRPIPLRIVEKDLNALRCGVPRRIIVNADKHRAAGLGRNFHPPCKGDKGVVAARHHHVIAELVQILFHEPRRLQAKPLLLAKGGFRSSSPICAAVTCVNDNRREREDPMKCREGEKKK